MLLGQGRYSAGWGRVSKCFLQMLVGKFLIYPTPMVNKKNEKSAILCVWWGVIITRKPIHFPWELFHGILATKISAHCLRNHLTKLHSIGTGGTRYQIQTYPCACFKCKKNKKIY